MNRREHLKSFFKTAIIIVVVLLVIIFQDTFIKHDSSAPKKENEVLNYSEKVNTPGPLKILEKYSKPNEDTNSEINISNIIKLTNAERVKNGNLPMLIENIDLDQSAKEKTEDMFKKQYFEHISPDNKGVGDLAKENGYDYITIGENLALGDFGNEVGVIEAWMNSAGHRANILNEKYSEIGVYSKKGIFKDKEVWIIVQHFGLPLSSCPQINEDLKSIIESSQNKSDDMYNTLKIMKEDLDKNYIFTYINGSKYQEKAKEYNALVEEYNMLIIEIKSNIVEYNKQVELFNQCVQNR